MGENFYELPVTEIENLITSDILKQTLLIENPKKENEISVVFEKEKNFANKKLGKFIDSLFPNGEIKSYSAISGTIKNKVGFCNSVIEVTDNYEKLSKEAKLITEKLYDFIRKNNLT